MKISLLKVGRVRQWLGQVAPHTAIEIGQLGRPIIDTKTRSKIPKKFKY